MTEGATFEALRLVDYFFAIFLPIVSVIVIQYVTFTFPNLNDAPAARLRSAQRHWQRMQKRRATIYL